MKANDQLIHDPSVNDKTNSVNILIVDDRPENIISLASILEGDNRNILKANSGNEALKTLEEESV
jgi:CheY-like chemotaxis protein